MRLASSVGGKKVGEPFHHGQDFLAALVTHHADAGINLHAAVSGS